MGTTTYVKIHVKGLFFKSQLPVERFKIRFLEDFNLKQHVRTFLAKAGLIRLSDSVTRKEEKSDGVPNSGFSHGSPLLFTAEKLRLKGYL